MIEEGNVPELLDEEPDEQELYEHFAFKVDPNQGLLRIDKFLNDKLGKVSRNRIQNALIAGNILVNGSAVKANYRVKPQDQISIVLPHPKRTLELIAQNIPLDIVFEDSEFIIVNKPAGMVVHPGYGNYQDTLVNALIYHFDKLPHNNGNPTRPGLVHRIDKNTSGLLVIAKTEIAMNHLAKAFFDRNIDRKYVALVWGNLEQDSGTITGNLARSLKNRKVMDVFPDGDVGKHAITHYTVLERFGYVTLVECKLETGRTHQIRVHFQHIGHSLFNDSEYGGDKILKGTVYTKYKQFVENCFQLCPRQALHAKSLGFTHPVTGEKIYHETPLPPDMTAVIEKWRNYSAAGMKD